MRQIATTLSRREEWKLSSQLVANPKGQYLVAEKKDEQVGPPKDPTLVKDKGQFKMSQF
jgi:hypothetical protein